MEVYIGRSSEYPVNQSDFKFVKYLFTNRKHSFR